MEIIFYKYILSNKIKSTELKKSVIHFELLSGSGSKYI